MKVHYTERYLLNPGHRVTVDLVGVGGTGTRVLTGLARINEALTALGHPGLHVRAWDDDIVTQANIGRQLFSSSDIGINKAIVSITRINRFFGYEWEAKPMAYGGQAKSNIIISCIDSAKGRVMLDMWVTEKDKYKQEPYNTRYYWLDLGNSQKTGQCILGTLKPIPQLKTETKSVSTLPTVIKKFPQIRKMVGKDHESGPSCSLAEALEKQDLFINSTLAEFGCNIIWKLLREGKIINHGCFVNLETMSVNPIKVA